MSSTSDHVSVPRCSVSSASVVPASVDFFYKSGIKFFSAVTRYVEFSGPRIQLLADLLFGAKRCSLFVPAGQLAEHRHHVPDPFQCFHHLTFVAGNAWHTCMPSGGLPLLSRGSQHVRTAPTKPELEIAQQ